MSNKLKIVGRAAVLHRPGAVRLDGFPRLVFAPKQYGDGVRTEDRGIPVETIAGDHASGSDFESIAAKHGTTADHVRDAIGFAVQSGYLA